MPCNINIEKTKEDLEFWESQARLLRKEHGSVILQGIAATEMKEIQSNILHYYYLLKGTHSQTG